MNIFLVDSRGVCQRADSRVASGEFHVLQAYGPRQEECIEDAITTAKVTGSRGATVSIGGDVTEESLAKVERVMPPPTFTEVQVIYKRKG